MFTIVVTRVCAVWLAACDTAPSAPAPETSVLGAPPVNTWHLHAVDGETLSAMVAHRLLPENRLEQTYVDSSQLDITSDGRYEQRTFTRVFIDGQLDASDARLDAGRWSATDTGYVFDSDIVAKQFLIRTPGTDSMRVVQRLVERAEAGRVVGLFRTSPRPRS